MEQVILRALYNTKNDQNIRSSYNSISTIDSFHKNIHDGNVYEISYSKAVAASSDILIWFQSPSTSIQVHLYAEMTASGYGKFDIWKGTVSATSQWAAITPWNTNEWSTNATQLVAFTGGVASTSVNSLRHVEYVGSQGTFPSGGSAGKTEEIIMAAASTYMVRFVDASTGSNVAFNIRFYEQTV